MAKLTANGYLLGQRIIEKTRFSGFSGNLQQNAWQFFRIAQNRFKLTKEYPTRVYKVNHKRKRQLYAEKNCFGPKFSKKWVLWGFQVRT